MKLRVSLTTTALLTATTVLATPALATAGQPAFGALATLTAPAAHPAVAPVAVTAGPLTNLAHLNYLGDAVRPPAQAGHTTYRLDTEPDLGVLWTYSERLSDGTYSRIGGGPYHAATNTYDQGAFNSDDMARAAVVYLRHWKQTGSASSRQRAYELLRGVMYMQTATGPNRGNLVLWMQPDGTLNPSPIIVEQPNPSDSDASYWLARGVWALGEGYAAFKQQDPAFAAALGERLDLAVGALDREVLNKYGTYLQIDGRRTPAWLIVNGADATAEAVLGLSAYVQASGSASARTALSQFSRGIAALSDGDARNWPFGAILPWALSKSVWHAWAGQEPAALARASQTLGDQNLARLASKDSNVFDPWLLTSGGPDNGRLPTRVDGTQIAYGVDSRVQSLFATADATGEPGPKRLAAITAAWFFGGNPAGTPAYDPSTGRTIDGISPTGQVNRNAGAESTIHGLLTMLALDAAPDVAGIAEHAGSTYRRVGSTTLQAEDARLSGAATVVTPASLWTGESQYGGTGYAAIRNGGSVTFTVPSGGPRLLMPVVDLQPGSTAITTFKAGNRFLGIVWSGAIGPQGASPAPGALLPVTMPLSLPDVPAGSTTEVTATTISPRGDVAKLDALMLEPEVSQFVVGGDGHDTALLRNAGRLPTTSSVSLAGTGPARVETYNGSGELVAARSADGSQVPVQVLQGGYSIVLR